jgi:hypothetical protein
VVNVCSQPFGLLPSQLPQPELHEEIAHEPVEHVAVACAREHAVPHEPQWVSVFKFCSQPLLALPSQFPKPELQLEIAQLPVEHVAVAFAREQPTPQPPQ